MSAYVYIRTEPQLWTVGFYDPAGKWHPDQDYPDTAQAAARVHYLNGGNPTPEPGKPREPAKRLPTIEDFR